LVLLAERDLSSAATPTDASTASESRSASGTFRLRRTEGARNIKQLTEESISGV
jgi:hypothetical protein